MSEPELFQFSTPMMLVVLVVFFGSMLIITARIAKREESVDAYMVSTGRMGFGISAASMTATWIWAASYYGAATSAYTYGVSGAVHYGLWGALMLLFIYPIGQRFRALAPNAHTLGEVMWARHGTASQLALVFSNFLGSGGSLVVNITACGALVSVLSPLTFFDGVLAAGVGILDYTLWSGFRASVITDFVQVSALMLVTIVAIPVILYTVGGPGELAAHGEPDRGAARPVLDGCHPPSGSAVLRRRAVLRDRQPDHLPTDLRRTTGPDQGRLHHVDLRVWLHRHRAGDARSGGAADRSAADRRRPEQPPSTDGQWLPASRSRRRLRGAHPRVARLHGRRGPRRHVLGRHDRHLWQEPRAREAQRHTDAAGPAHHDRRHGDRRARRQPQSRRPDHACDHRWPVGAVVFPVITSVYWSRVTNKAFATSVLVALVGFFIARFDVVPVPDVGLYLLEIFSIVGGGVVLGLMTFAFLGRRLGVVVGAIVAIALPPFFWGFVRDYPQLFAITVFYGVSAVLCTALTLASKRDFDFSTIKDNVTAFQTDTSGR